MERFGLGSFLIVGCVLLVGGVLLVSGFSSEDALKQQLIEQTKARMEKRAERILSHAHPTSTLISQRFETIEARSGGGFRLTFLFEYKGMLRNETLEVFVDYDSAGAGEKLAYGLDSGPVPPGMVREVIDNFFKKL